MPNIATLPNLGNLNRDSLAALLCYCVDAAINPLTCYVDVDAGQLAPQIEQIEALPDIDKLALASDLLHRLQKGG